MSEQATKAVASVAPVATEGVLQRKCACGNHTTSGGTCESCRKKQKNGGMSILRYAAGGDIGGMALSQPGDLLEREADAAAHRIVGPGPMPAATGAPVHAISAGATSGQMTAEGMVRSVLDRPGLPLPRTVRAQMEDGFGQDFSGVRIHADASAARSADAVGALAYTVGHSIVFGRGQFLPETATGQRLLAHELAHVVQQRSGRVRAVIARESPEEACPKGHRIGENVKYSGTPKGDTVVYIIWGTWKEGDNSDRFLRRTFAEWIRWRFGAIDAKQSSDALAYAMKHMNGDPPPATAGCQVGITVDYSAMRDLRRISGEVDREKAAAEKKKADEAAKKAEDKPAGDPSGTATEPGAEPPAGEKPGGGAPSGDKAPGDKSGGGPSGEPKAEGGKPSIGDFGMLGEAVAEDEVLDQYLTTRIKPDITVLADPKRAELYLQILQHYTGRAIADTDTKAAADGLTQAEVDTITDGKPMRKALTALYGQGYREFEHAGGSELEKFSILIQTVCEQFSRGNPTATHNQLQIGKGFPEKDILGIVERSTGILLYDNLGVALASFGGVGTRDRGYIATRIDKDAWGLNIAKIKDPGLRELLNSLRLTFSEPTRMAIAGAEVYFNNIELVNGKVQAGLDAKVKEKFVDMLPYFVGFIAGHAVSSFLMRVPNPHVAAVGLTLKGLLTVAGYIMEIDFAAGAMERLLSAAALLSKFQRDEADQVTKLSEANLNEAAKIIQDMVAEIAALFATMALGKLLSGAHKGIEKLRIECTHCDLKGGSAAEAKAPAAEAKAGEAKPGEAKPGEAKPAEPKPAEPKAEAKPEGTPDAKPREPTAQEKAKLRLEELGTEKAAKERELSELRRQREALRREHNEAIDARNEAVKEWDAAKGDRAKADAARAKAREAQAKAEVAKEKMEELQSDEGLSKDLKKLEGEIGIESIKADPGSRGLLPCFAPDTLVWTPQGPRPITALHAGDEVWTFDFGTGARRARPVRQVHHGRTLAFHRLRTDRGEILATGQHRFWVESDLAWRIAESLVPGEILRDAEGRRLRVLENLREPVDAAATCTLSIEEFHNFYVGPGALVHNEPVDVGLGGDFVIYRGTNPDYPGKVYIGQTTDLDIHGDPRGSETRQGEHQKTARKRLAEDAAGTRKLSARDKAFYEFMKNATLEPIVKGIGTQDQCDYLEQRNIELERQVSGKDNVMNRRNEITKPSHMKEVVERIKADPNVRAKGYCA